MFNVVALKLQRPEFRLGMGHTEKETQTPGLIAVLRRQRPGSAGAGLPGRLVGPRP